MSSHDPLVSLPTHEVSNLPPILEHYNLFETDPALREAVAREGAGWAEDRCDSLGAEIGTPQWFARGHLANANPPELRGFDRHGRRIDEVEFHPAYHQLMELALRHQQPTLPWIEPKPGAHVAHVALAYLFTQVEAGVLCPMAMTYAVVPALRHQPEVAQNWIPKILASEYDPRCIPAADKRGVTLGMAMTEKQGGSDVRANTTLARPEGRGGAGHSYRLRGHKWFCSAPMSDAFLTLAQTDQGLSCFLVPRFCPDGTRNNFFIQRLKNKLGNRSNASSELEYHDTWAQMVGEPGHGVRTIIEMVHHTRLDAATAPVGLMRQALVQAAHHCKYREVFGKRLLEQPLMRNVLADLALEVEAGTALVMRVARAFDEAAANDEQAELFARIATAVTKYWTNKRCPGHIYECMESLGGNGYVEDSGLPRLYREAPLNSIWEGSGNVICLDVLRAMGRDPRCLEVLMAEVEPALHCDAALRAAKATALELAGSGQLEAQGRRFTEGLAKLLCGSLLRQHAPAAIADAYIDSRLRNPTAAYGTLGTSHDLGPILQRIDVG